MVTEYFIFSELKQHWQNQSHPTSGSAPRNQNCQKLLTNLLEQLRLHSSTKMQIAALRNLLTRDLLSLHISKVLRNVSEEETSRNIHFLHETRLLYWPQRAASPSQ